MASQTTNLKLTKPSYSDVADINVLNGNFDIIDEDINKRSKVGHKHKMDDIEGLSLEAKNVTIEDIGNLFNSDNVEGALKELFQNVSNGKSSIAAAITDKGVPASASNSFSTLANKISQIISELLNIPFPTFSINVGYVNATFDTLNDTFKEFRLEGQAWQTSNIFRNLQGNSSYKFEGKYGGNRVSKLTVITPKANQGKPSTPVASNILGDKITVTAPSGCKIRFKGNNFNSPHTFTNLDINTVYEFYSYKPATDKLNESPVSDVLRVQTLNKLTLLGSGGNYPLNDASKWEIYRSNTSYQDYPGYFKIQNDKLKVYSGYAGFAVDIGIRTIDNIDLSKYSKFVFVVSEHSQTSNVSDQNGTNVGINGFLGGINVHNKGTFEVDISSANLGKVDIYVEAWVREETTTEISEIYLTN